MVVRFKFHGIERNRGIQIETGTFYWKKSFRVLNFLYLVSVYQCPENLIKCDDGLECIPRYALCDGSSGRLADCNDGSDEVLSYCKGMKNCKTMYLLTLPISSKSFRAKLCY